MPLSTAELTRLTSENEIITVRNTMNTFTVFEDASRNLSYLWGPAGDPDGEDLQEVSSVVLRHPGFRRAFARGIYEIEDAPEALQEAMEAQKKAWEARQARVEQAGSLAQRASDRTIGHGVQCIAPGVRGEICGSYSLAMGQNPNERPPLCAEHIGLANQYVIVETDIIGPDGKAEVVWRRASLVRARG